MEPIVPIEKPKAAPTPVRGTLADMIASIIAGGAALIALAFSALFFSRFLENDTHIWSVLSAFILCFGVGAFGYVPAAIIALMAWSARKKGAAKTHLNWAILLLLPWVVLALTLTFVSDMPKLYSLPILITVSLLTAWALISLRNLRTR